MAQPTRDASPPAGDWLDAALDAEGAAHRAAYIDDEGFTSAVMARLPAPAALPAWRRPVLTALWGLAAVGVAVALPGTLLDVAREVFRIVGGQPVSLAGLAAGAVALAAMSWGATAFALRRD
jgi:hypothetical protein